MNLSWLQYQHGLKSQYYLVLVIADQPDRYCTLLTSDITDHEIGKIRRDMKTLTEMPIGDRVTWLKKHITGYNRAYKEFRKDRARIERTLELVPLNDGRPEEHS